MELSHQAVVQTHAHHLGQHLAAKVFSFTGTQDPLERFVEQPLTDGFTQISGRRSRMAMIGRRRPKGDKNSRRRANALR